MHQANGKTILWKVRKIDPDLQLQLRHKFDLLGKDLGIRSKEDWYQITHKQICGKFARALLLNFDSLPAALKRVYPEHEWTERSFRASHGYWSVPKNQKECLDWIGTKLGIRELDDWYKVKSRDVMRHGGSSLLFHFGNSMCSMMSGVHPEVVWLPWRFSHVPRGYWESLENRRECLEWLGRRLGVKGMEDWYKFGHAEVVRCGGGGLLRHFGYCLGDVLSSVYPSHEWQPWKFMRAPEGTWMEPENRKRFVGWLGKELKVESLEEWYRISLSDVGRVAPVTPFLQHGFADVLMETYPDHSWDVSKLLERRGPIKSAQRHLAMMVSQIFDKCGKLRCDLVTL